MCAPRRIRGAHSSSATVPEAACEAPDLVAASSAALSERLTVVLVEQPYRVAGRRSPPPASHLDTAWIAIVESLRTDVLESLPVIVGGRSMGGRVALRTVEQTGAVAVLCLAFPLEPPGRKNPQNRLPELRRSGCRCSSSRASATRSESRLPDPRAKS